MKTIELMECEWCGEEKMPVFDSDGKECLNCGWKGGLTTTRHEND